MNSQKNDSRDIPACRALLLYNFISQEKDKEKHLRKS